MRRLCTAFESAEDVLKKEMILLSLKDRASNCNEEEATVSFAKGEDELSCKAIYGGEENDARDRYADSSHKMLHTSGNQVCVCLA